MHAQHQWPSAIKLERHGKVAFFRCWARSNSARACSGLAPSEPEKGAGLCRGTTSVHEDVRRGKKTEVDWIIKPFIDKGQELGVPVPTLTAAYRIIKTLDNYLG